MVVIGTTAGLYISASGAAPAPPVVPGTTRVGVMGYYPLSDPVQIYWSEPMGGNDAIYKCQLPDCLPTPIAHGPGTIVQIDVTVNALYWVTQNAIFVANP